MPLQGYRQLPATFKGGMFSCMLLNTRKFTCHYTKSPAFGRWRGLISNPAISTQHTICYHVSEQTMQKYFKLSKKICMLQKLVRWTWSDINVKAISQIISFSETEKDGNWLWTRNCKNKQKKNNLDKVSIIFWKDCCLEIGFTAHFYHLQTSENPNLVKRQETWVSLRFRNPPH